jgi:hypothetical protein
MGPDREAVEGRSKSARSVHPLGSMVHRLSNVEHLKVSWRLLQHSMRAAE